MSETDTRLSKNALKFHFLQTIFSLNINLCSILVFKGNSDICISGNRQYIYIYNLIIFLHATAIVMFLLCFFPQHLCQII